MNPRPLLVTASLLAPLALAQAPRPLPSLAAATRVVDAATGRELGFDELLDALAELDAVFLGETHIDDTTHRVELFVLEQLLARRQGKVVLSMEMFERDAQPVLDAYLAGEIDEQEFVARSNAWQNYRTGYRPLVEAAKAAGIPVVAANFPRSLRPVLARGGKAAIDALTPAQRALMPDEIFPASEGYWERVDRAIRGHAGFGMGGGGARTPEERRYDTQNLWDNSMGDNVARARAAHPDAVVLHVAGGFHVAYRDGTVAQFARRSEGSRHAVVQVAPVLSLDLARPERDRDEADYLVYAAGVARGHNEGTFAVSVGKELRYRLDVPDGKDGLPLLVWLPDGEQRPEDAFAYWQQALGGAAAVAVVEPPLPELQDDLAQGGRYVTGDGFRADYGYVQHGVERVVEYVTRRFPIDQDRVVVAGAGAGGAAVLWTALYGDWLEGQLVAVDPADLTRLAMEALPDQRPATGSLQLVARQASAASLEKVAADFLKVGTPAEVVEAGDAAALCAFVRGWLGLPARGPAEGAPDTWLVLERELPRARAWAETLAERRRAAGQRVRVVAAGEVPADAAAESVQRLAIGGDGLWPVEGFAHGDGLPLPGGEFGGTTVVVLLPNVLPAERARWLDYEARKVIKRRSMFANLAVAELDGERSLSRVVAGLTGMGRSRVLVVPAVFCADAAMMRALEVRLGDAAAGVDLYWLPGLGGEVVRGDR